MFLVALVVLGPSSGCNQPTSTAERSEGRTVTATVVTIETSPVPVYAVVPGTVVSADQVQIASRLMGYVSGLAVHEGQTVNKGELLLVVNPTEVNSEIRQAEAQVAKARASLSDAKANYERYKVLYEGQAVTEQEYQQMEMAYKVAVGSHQAAKAALAAARAQQKYAQVRAPFDGLVVSKLVDNGQLAAPGTPLLVLENPEHLQAEVQVPEQAYEHLKLGRDVRVQFEGENFEMRTVTGRVERLVSAADPATHTHLAKIGLPAEPGIRSGEFVQVSIPVGAEKGIVVPAAAIRNRAGIEGVFVVNIDGEAQFRMVTLGPSQPEGVVVLSGLFPGDRLIVSPEGQLANGVKVRVRAEPGAGHEG